jgi:phosphatidylserine/phosphatidylglycerophosphate/cardiolipin synthase-like enzyme
MWNGTDIPEIFSYKPKEKSSVLHAKVLIIDDARILVTSANVTGSALNRNIEMGLYHSGKAAKDARKLFTSLIDDGYMVKV